MKARYLIAVLVFTCSGPVAAGSDEDTLRHIKTTLWQQAYRTQDTELLDQILHDTFVVIDDAGNVSTKAQEIAWISENAWDPGEFEYRIERLDIYGDAYAIVAGTGVAATYSYKSSNVLIKEDGRWRAVSSHVSGVESSEKPEASDTAFHAISVFDMDQSIAWYTEKLGFELDFRGGNDVRDGALLTRNGGLLELARFNDAVRLSDLDADRESHEVVGVFKLGFVTSDIDATFVALQENGVDILFGIVDASDGRRTFGVTDPDGNIVQFFGGAAD